MEEEEAEEKEDGKEQEQWEDEDGSAKVDGDGGGRSQGRWRRQWGKKPTANSTYTCALSVFLPHVRGALRVQRIQN